MRNQACLEYQGSITRRIAVQPESSESIPALTHSVMFNLNASRMHHEVLTMGSLIMHAGAHFWRPAKFCHLVCLSTT